MLQHRSTYMEVNDLLQAGMSDAAFVCTYAYIRGRRSFGMELLVVPVVAGKTTYQSYVIVPLRTVYSSLLELQNKRFASADLTSTSGWLFPALWLIENGKAPLEFFSDHIISGSHDKSIMLVVQGYAAGAAVDSIVYEQMPDAVKNKTKIILRSPEYGMPPFVVHPALGKKLKGELQGAFLSVHLDNNGKKALDNLHIERFVIPQPGYYKNVAEMAEKWESYLEELAS